MDSSFMKILLTLLLCTTFAFSQNKAVTQNVTTNRVNNSLTFTDNNRLMIGSGNDPGELVVDNNGQISLVNGGIYGDQGKIALNTFTGLSAPIFNGVDAMISANASNNHAILGRSPYPTDGIGVIGWSSSGAAAVKAKQDTYFTSPALSVVRNLANAQEAPIAPALKIFITDWSEPSPAWSELAQLPALSIENPNSLTPAFQVSWGGAITGNPTFTVPTIFTNTVTFNGSSNAIFDGSVNFNSVPQFRFGLQNTTFQLINFTHTRGWYNPINNTRLHPIYKGTSATALATGSLDTSMVGDTYFNTSDNRMYMLTPNGWRAITSP
jgi:hypothetical protein